jgi:hypothetical protein
VIIFNYLYSADKIHFIFYSLNRLYKSEINIQWEKKATGTLSKYSFPIKIRAATVNSPSVPV